MTLFRPPPCYFLQGSSELLLQSYTLWDTEPANLPGLVLAKMPH